MNTAVMTADRRRDTVSALKKKSRLSKTIDSSTAEESVLLYPAGKKPQYKVLGDDTCSDLFIESIVDQITENDSEKKIIMQMMTKLESDPETIRYRCDIFEDMISFPQLREKIGDMLGQLEYLRTLEKSYKDETSAPIWQLVTRLKELEVYIDCITGIKDALAENPVRSEGLLRLRDDVDSICSEGGFSELKSDIRQLLSERSRIKSITLGINLDDMMCPEEVGILSINSERFDHTGILDKFLGFCSKFSDAINANTGMTVVHRPGVNAESDPLMGNLTAAVTGMLSSNVRHMKSVLSRYVNISGYSLTKYIPEFIFYIRWAEFCIRIREAGLPMTRPEILAAEKRTLTAKNLYNIKLALKRTKNKEYTIVGNDFEFTKEHGIYIMTGPNRGGKTTFTQAVGWLFLLAQHGIYVPCDSLALSPCDNILTHFPADENKTVDLGRLGEESKRISSIFSEATSRSLLLFNEPLASTSFTEGLYIARTVFNTHMHELAMRSDEINMLEGDMKVASLVTGVHEGIRSYKVYIAPPEGLSYAKDIAKKYGVTTEQLKRTIKK